MGIGMKEQDVCWDAHVPCVMENQGERGDMTMLPYHIKGFTFTTMNAQNAVPSVVVSCIHLYFKAVMKQADNYLEFLNHSWITAEIKYGRTLSAWSDVICLYTAGTAFSFCSQVSEVRKCLPLCLVSINSPWKKLSSNRFFPSMSSWDWSFIFHRAKLIQLLNELAAICSRSLPFPAGKC